MKPGSGPQEVPLESQGQRAGCGDGGEVAGGGGGGGEKGSKGKAFREERKTGWPWMSECLWFPLPFICSFNILPTHLPGASPCVQQTHTVLDAWWSSVNICRRKKDGGEPLCALCLSLSSHHARPPGAVPLWLSPEPAVGLLASSRRPVLHTHTHGDLSMTPPTPDLAK